ncbi:MAG: response regulator transcription factor [Draconibacterium sp.]
MINPVINIGVIEPSPIVIEGIESLLLKLPLRINIILIRDFEDMTSKNSLRNLDFLIINPTQLFNRTRQVKMFRFENPKIKWFGIVYAVFDKETLSNFDEIISIDDTRDTILKKIQKHIKSSDDRNSNSLSDREIDVLKEIVRGRANKEIADVLNISIHTVMSHRKNIMQKTGIKSQAGLTVYALTNNILSVDSI